MLCTRAHILSTCIGIWIALLVPLSLFANTENIGFVEGLWYAQSPVFADNPTRVYVAFRNNSPDDIQTTVRFSDNGKRIGSAEVQALSGRLIEAWVDWKPTYGTHTITVTLGNTTFHAIGKEPRSVSTDDITIEETIEVDYDTDGDRIPNKEDTDDDNDGVSDIDEKERGSNPLVSNPQSKTTEEKDSGNTKKSTDSKEESRATLERSDSVTVSGRDAQSTPGLEQHLGSGIGHTLLGNVTEKVTDAKQSLDRYRLERNTLLYSDENSESIKDTEDTGTSTDTATITRSKIDASSNSFLSAFVDGVRKILQNVWTFFLFILSKLLTHPALIQVALLFAILYIIYRLMRRVGRRPTD